MIVALFQENGWLRAFRMGMRAWVACLALLLAACGNNDAAWQGWVEADTIFVSPDEGGRIVKLGVREGDHVQAGNILFALDDEIQTADLNQTNASLENTRLAFERAQQLMKTGAASQREFDTAQSAYRIAQAQGQTAKTRLTRRVVRSPVSGLVQQVYFREGEMTSSQRPVIAILPPENLKIRFYVAELEIAKIKIGDIVLIQCDGCAGPMKAQVTFKSQSVEYTPPVIYSLEERAKLVFLIQARPENPAALHVGQPVRVMRNAAP